MEITQQVRDYAAKLADPGAASAAEAVAALTAEERQKGMKEMSAKFRAMGSEVYVEEQ